MLGVGRKCTRSDQIVQTSNPSIQTWFCFWLGSHKPDGTDILSEMSHHRERYTISCNREPHGFSGSWERDRASKMEIIDDRSMRTVIAVDLSRLRQWQIWCLSKGASEHQKPARNRSRQNMIPLRFSNLRCRQWTSLT